MKPGSDMPWGCASSLTLVGPLVSCSITPRRVRSDSAQNTWSRTAGSAMRMAYLRGSGCSMLTRLPSVSWKAT